MSILRFISLLILSLVIGYAQSSTCNAGLILGFSTDSSPQPGSISSAELLPGQTINISVFAIQQNETRLSDYGLIAVGTRATFNTAFGNVSNNAISSNFDNSAKNVSVDNSVGFLNLKGLTINDTKASSILIGSFRFNATAAGETVLRFGDFNTNNNNSDFTLGNEDSDDLDGDFFGANRLQTHNFTITAVPEPSTLILVGLAASSMGAAAWRKRKRSATRTQASH